MFFRIVLFVFLMCASPARSFGAEGYADISWLNLINTMVRFNAINMSDDVMIDEYALISECDLYKSFYANEFKWNQVRGALRESLKMNTQTYPTKYHYDSTLELERYNFRNMNFRFSEKTPLRNINSLVIYSVEGTSCPAAEVLHMPRSFRTILTVPLTLEGLPLSEDDAEALLARMRKNNNANRVIYVRYNLRIIYVQPMKINAERKREDEPLYVQTGKVASKDVRFDTYLDSIEFFEDPQRTKLIYTYGLNGL
ncbi:MAG: DUF4852 domain-containing protein [Bdellovibrionales bacterium]